nr:right-handed parallel beta-helix repeat-containing protein [uncultured Methanolobus sp.]
MKIGKVSWVVLTLSIIFMCIGFAEASTLVVDCNYNGSSGGVSVASTIVVYPTIQEAIDDALPGDTISVMPGIYEESITVDKSVKLEAPDGATIKCPDTPEIITLAESSKTYEYVVGLLGGTYSSSNDTVYGSDCITVEMSGFTIDASNFTPSQRWSSVICRNVNRDNSEILSSIHDNTFENILVDGKETFAILGYGSMNITIQDNLIDQFARGGIGLYSGDNEVIGNTVIGPYNGDNITWAPNGIQFGYGASGLIQDNDVSHCGWPGTDWEGTAIMVVDTSNVTVDENYVHDNEVAISVTDYPIELYSSEVWAATCSDITVTNNLVENNEYGIDIANGVDTVVVENNDILNNIYDGISVYDYEVWYPEYDIPDPVNVEIHNNNIVGNGDSGLYVDVNITEVDAALNWWGDVTGPYHETTNSAGTGDNVTDNAVYSPWLGAEFDTTPMIYYVTPYGKIQDAIEAANPVDTIFLLPGTYSENIDVNRKVSLIGSGSGTDPLVDSILQKDTDTRIVKLSASGNSEEDPVLIKDIRIAPDGVYAFEVHNNESVSYLEFDNVHVVGATTHTVENEIGLKIATDGSLSNFVVKDSTFDNCDYGWYFAKTVDINETSNVQFVTVDDSSFSENDYKGIYVEKLSDATFNNVLVDNNGKSDFWNQVWNGGFDINLKAGNYANLVFNNLTVTNNGLGYKEGAGIMIKARDDGSYVSPNDAVLDGVQINGGTYSFNERGIRIGEPDKNNAGPINVVITGANITDNVQTYSGTDGSAYGGVVNYAQEEVNATDNWWGDDYGPYNENTNPSGVGNAVTDNVDYIPWVATVIPIPECDFTANVTSGNISLTVQFTDISTNNPDSWEWDFGDGNSSTESNPVYTYSTPGSYNVTLTASNEWGEDTEIKAEYIVLDDWNPWNDPSSAGNPDGTYITIEEVIAAYNCWRFTSPAPGTGLNINIEDVIAMYNAWRFNNSM